MTNGFGSICDDFYFHVHVYTELDLPQQRDTIMAFFEKIQRQFPSMGFFYRRKSKEYCLEEDRSGSQCRWVTLEPNCISSGVVNPADLQDVCCQHRLVLDTMSYMLGISHLDINCLDVSYTMDFEYYGNHDEVIAEALFDSTPLNCLLDLPSAVPIGGFSPSIVIGLAEDCRTQARINIESKTSDCEPWRRKYKSEDAISLSLTIRQYSRTAEKFDPVKSFEQQYRLVEELMASKIIPNFVKPLVNAISHKNY